MEFNDSVLEYLRNAPSVRVVALSSEFSTYWDDSARGTKRLLGRTRAGFEEKPRSYIAALDSLAETIRAIRGAGRAVVVVAQPPATDFDVGECMERRKTGRAIVLPKSAASNCFILRHSYDEAAERNREFFVDLKKRVDVEVIDFDSALCDARSCTTEIDGVLVYGFRNHLSYEGSVAVAKKMELGSSIERLAR